MQIQLFLFVLILGFLTGPHVMQALQKTDTGDMRSSPYAARVISSNVADGAMSTAQGSEKEDPYTKLNLQAKSVYVWDIAEHRKLYGFHEETQLPLASVTKMMMAIVASDILPRDATVTVTPDDLQEEGDSGLLAEEKWKFSDLLRFTLIESSNDGASAIARAAGMRLRQQTTKSTITDKQLFIQKMNEKARIMDLEHTYYNNESGLDIGTTTSGGYGSTRDMAMLFEYILKKHPEIFTPTTHTVLDLRSESNILHRAVNTNDGVEHITGIIASKTGYTDLAGGNLVIILDIGPDHPIVIAALGSTEKGRFTDVRALIGATVEKITGEVLPRSK